MQRSHDTLALDISAWKWCLGVDMSYMFMVLILEPMVKGAHNVLHYLHFSLTS